MDIIPKLSQRLSDLISWFEQLEENFEVLDSHATANKPRADGYVEFAQLFYFAILEYVHIKEAATVIGTVYGHTGFIVQFESFQSKFEVFTTQHLFRPDIVEYVAQGFEDVAKVPDLKRYNDSSLSNYNELIDDIFELHDLESFQSFWSKKQSFSNSMSSQWGSKLNSAISDYSYWVRDFDDFRLALEYHVLAYRKNTYRIPSLIDREEDVLSRILNSNSNNISRNMNRELTHQLEHIEISGHSREIISTIADLISNIGYDQFRKDFQDLGSEVLGGNPINVIPGSGSGQCCERLLVLASGSTGKNGLFELLTKANDHLIDCMDSMDICKEVIVVTDFWDSAKYRKTHHGTVSSWMHKGRTFVFLLVGTPDRHLSTIPVFPN